MADVLMVIGGVFVLYLIGLGVVGHFEKKQVPELKDGD